MQARRRNTAPHLLQLAAPSRQGWLLGRPGDVSFNIGKYSTAIHSSHVPHTLTTHKIPICSLPASFSLAIFR